MLIVFLAVKVVLIYQQLINVNLVTLFAKNVMVKMITNVLHAKMVHI